MKMSEANDIISAFCLKQIKEGYSNEKGFMIHFEKREGGMLKSGYFPDKHAGEKLISSIEDARLLAKQFAAATDDSYVNIYVIDESFLPRGTNGYFSHTLKKYSVYV